MKFTTINLFKPKIINKKLTFKCVIITIHSLHFTIVYFASCVDLAGVTPLVDSEFLISFSLHLMYAFSESISFISTCRSWASIGQLSQQIVFAFLQSRSSRLQFGDDSFSFREPAKDLVNRPNVPCWFGFWKRVFTSFSFQEGLKRRLSKDNWSFFPSSNQETEIGNCRFGIPFRDQKKFCSVYWRRLTSA